jgi:hypothetical protein
MLQRTIQSNEFKDGTGSFTVSAPNNIGELMTRLWEEAKPVPSSDKSEKGPLEVNYNIIMKLLLIFKSLSKMFKYESKYYY